MAEKAVEKKYELSRSAIVRIVKKSGAERIGPEAVDAVREKTEAYVGELTKKALAAAQHANRKIIRAEDVSFVG